MMGRPNKPTVIKAAEGNPGKRKLRRGELLQATEAPAAPRWLSVRARREWRRIVPILVGRRILRPEDQINLANICEAIATLVEAREELARMKGKRLLMKVGQRIVEVKKGRKTRRQSVGGSLVVNPLHYVIRDQVNTIEKLGAQFGFSPAARARLSYEDDTPIGAADPLEQLLAGEISDPTDHAVIQ
jgi:P27 family predicted phage terminase small subunit